MDVTHRSGSLVQLMQLHSSDSRATRYCAREILTPCISAVAFTHPAAQRMYERPITFYANHSRHPGARALQLDGGPELIFGEPGIEINGTDYRELLRKQHLLPAIKGLSGDIFTFRQDSTPAHRTPDLDKLSRRVHRCRTHLN